MDDPALSSKLSTPSSPAQPVSFEQFWHDSFAERHAAERAQEAQLQDEAFAGCTHTVCGLELRGMSAHDLLLLHGCGNPFVTGGALVPAALAQFLAILVEPAPRGWLARHRFFARVASYPYGKAVTEIKAYVRRMFASSGIALAQTPDPESQSSGGAEGPALNMCFVAPLVIRIASETGWAEADILSMRLDKLFQYRRAMDLRAGGKEPMAPSDRLLSEALAEYNLYLAGMVPMPAALESQASALNSQPSA